MLSDEQYKRISSFLPGKASDPGRTAADNRLFVEEFDGSPVLEVHGEIYHPISDVGNSVYKFFARWSRTKRWHSIFAELAGDADFEEVFRDSTSVRVHQHAAGSPKKTVPSRLVVLAED